ncbi:MAG TPA: hypothetical protein VKN99_08520 [Polyangia bacterium]|nr:hypothetical protein [Polyangia bacterium]
MRRIQLQSLLVSVVALLGVGGAGCGDDTVASPDAPIGDGPAGDRPRDAAADMMPDSPPPFESVNIGIVELHGFLPGPTAVMTAAVSVGATSSTFTPDTVTGTPPTNGCTASDFDVTPSGDAGGLTDPPPRVGNIGDVTVTNFQFSGNAIPSTQTTITCTHSATGYTCDFPNPTGMPGFDGIFPEVGGAAHWLNPGAILTVAAAGGADSAAFMSMPHVVDNFDANSVQAFTGTFTMSSCDSTGGSSFQLAGPGGIPDNQDLLVTFTCGTAQCGIVVVNFSSSSGSPAAPGPTFGTATCAKIITAAAQNCVFVPRAVLTRIKVANWTTIRTSVFRAGGEGLDLANHRAIVAGRGQLYLKAP